MMQDGSVQLQAFAKCSVTMRSGIELNAEQECRQQQNVQPTTAVFYRFSDGIQKVLITAILKLQVSNLHAMRASPSRSGNVRGHGAVHADGPFC
jgi:hypothetical protein